MWLEAGSLIEDLKGIGSLLDGQIVPFLIDLVVDSFRNTVAAFIWPAKAAQFMQPFGAIGLGLAFWLFPIYVKKHIEAWLFKDEKNVAETPPTQAADE